jgi:hypothetical protein
VSQQVRLKLKAAMQEVARLKDENEKFRRCFQGERDWVLVEPGEYARLNAEVERLTLCIELDEIDRRNGICCDAKYRFEELESKVDRLTKAGDAMVKRMRELDPMWHLEPAEEKVIINWNAAKEGESKP